jgi:hypothetical protein
MMSMTVCSGICNSLAIAAQHFVQPIGDEFGSVEEVDCPRRLTFAVGRSPPVASSGGGGAVKFPRQQCEYIRQFVGNAEFRQCTLWGGSQPCSWLHTAPFG